jgi:Ca2+-transporting ATPase
MDKKFYIAPIEEIFTIFNTSLRGLSDDEVLIRQKSFGKNVLEDKNISKFSVFFRQFNNIVIYVLLIASILSLLANKPIDFFIIFSLILLNAFIGFFQELKAESSIKALKKLTETKVRVLRNDIAISVPSSELVVGDIVLINEGDVITADIRLIESFGLMVDESLLTGESIPILKESEFTSEEELLPYEIKNMLLCGTTIVKGFGKALVVAISKNTYFAQIEEETLAESPKTPLVKALNFFSKRYVVLLLSLFLALGFYGYMQGRSWTDMAYIFLAELVSAVPEGLPLVMTLVMVIGAIELSKKKTLVRYLPSVETLGCATIIASDKTGTITEGKLSVERFVTDDIDNLKLIAALCNERGKDPLDFALSVWVENFEELRSKHTRIKSFPFDVNLRMTATINSVNGENILFVKGAFETLKEIAVNKEDIGKWEKELHKLSEGGLRVLAFGMGAINTGNLVTNTSNKNIDNIKTADANDYVIPKEMSEIKGSDNPLLWKIKIVGLIGFLDPPKKEIKEAIACAKKAHIKVMMLTGDHPLTAKAIAKQVGIGFDDDVVLTGKEIEKIDDDHLLHELRKTNILARILPEHKSRVVKLLQNNGEIVAVSGDGVNDAPALKLADLGIAMGSGTQAAKNVAKMIITDSNLKIIVDAIKIGRIIASNIRKVIYYLISTGIQEIVLLSLAIFANLPLPLTPIQILWINLISSGVQDKMFPFAKEEGNVMNRKPRNPKKQFLDLKQLFNIFWYGLGTGVICFALFKHLLLQFSYETALAVTFSCVIFMQLANSIQAQKEFEPFFKNIKMSFSINPFIFIGVAIAIIIQVFVLSIAGKLLTLGSFPIELWLYPILLFFISLLWIELRKWLVLIFEKVRKISI